MPPASSPPLPPLASRAPRRRRILGLTPLIDVVFILLVFFMLATSFQDWRTITLDAPGPTPAGALAPGAMLVDLRADGLRFAGERVSLAQLGERVGAGLSRRPEARVLVRTGPGVPLQDAVRVLDRLSTIGATDLALIRGGKG